MDVFAPHRVLVVDDNRDIANSVASLLRLLGHTVLAAYDGRTALVAARDFTPDTVLLDLMMPDMDGFEVARKLREMEALKAVKIVALTGFSQPAYIEATEAAGFDLHLTKPATAQELLGALT